MSALFAVPALLDWIVAGLYASEARWGHAAAWLVAGTLWLAGAWTQATARRIRRDIARELTP